MRRSLPLFFALLVPFASLAAADEDEEEPGWGGENEVVGGPLDLSHLGREPKPPQRFREHFERWPSWGLRESRFQLVPRGGGYEAVETDLSGITKAPWPGRGMLEAWDLGAAFSFPRLAPSLGVELFTFVGERQTDDVTLFNEQVRLDLYLAELRLNAVGSVEGRRVDQTDLDLDFRIPIRLGAKNRLALMPGATFPVDERPKTDENTAIRFQVLYGIGGGGFGFQGRLGFIEGSRARGLLQLDRTAREPAILYGALLGWRPVPGMQIRAEGSGEWATDGGVDRLTLLGGPVFFPFGDPRVSFGALGLIETTGEELDFERPVWGGVIQVGIGFL